MSCDDDNSIQDPVQIGNGNCLENGLGHNNSDICEQNENKCEQNENKCEKNENKCEQSENKCEQNKNKCEQSENKCEQKENKCEQNENKFDEKENVELECTYDESLEVSQSMDKIDDSKKNETKGVKRIKNKIKMFYRSKKDKDTKPSAEISPPAQQSAGLLSKIKNFKKIISSAPVESIDIEERPVCDSGSDIDSDCAESSQVTVEERKELEGLLQSMVTLAQQDLPTAEVYASDQPQIEDTQKLNTKDDEKTRNETFGIGRRYTSKFESGRLYQFYNKDKISKATQMKTLCFDESDEDDFTDEEEECIYEDVKPMSPEKEKVVEKVDQPAKVSTLEKFGNTGALLRTLWSEMPEVIESGVLESMPQQERKLQEAMFEIITSEATYLKSLNLLMDVFLLSEEFGCKVSAKSVITKLEQHTMFSNIGLIRDASERFLLSLESRWQESVVLNDIGDIISEHANKNFDCYVHYCSNQTFQERAMTDLKKKPEFVEALGRLEAKPECQRLSMFSFLLLPMQRITRLPLLVDAICKRLDPEKDKERHRSAIDAFQAVSKIVKRCNEGAKKMQQIEEMYLIAKTIEFPPNNEMTSIPLISSSRYLVKQEELVCISSVSAGRILSFRKAKPSRRQVHLYLFNDMLLVTKKRGDKFIVTDYAQRGSLHTEVLDRPETNTRLLPFGVPGGCQFLFLLVMLENHENKQTESVFACKSMSDRVRWVNAVTPVKVNDSQLIYEDWDCPQVQCIKKYVAMEPDELSLEESDIVNIYKKHDDGMYEGERLRDGERGWFPKDHTVEILNSHVRARNMRVRYRMLTAAENIRKQ